MTLELTYILFATSSNIWLSVFNKISAYPKKHYIYSVKSLTQAPSKTV